MSGGESADPRGNSTKSGQSTEIQEDYGYGFFPERGGKEEKGFFSKIFNKDSIGYRGASRNFFCVRNVYWCVQNCPAVKLLVQALESRGCPLNLSRHVSCEDCTHKVNGGFDPINKQVVVCQNNSKYKAVACSVLAHELTHMFDYCRAKVDFTNLEHLACTEIRAANFFHCSFMSALAEGDTSPFDYKMTHQECVRRKALWSVLVVRNIKREEGEAVVDKVFDRCYSDLEPFGRRLRPKSKDFERALGEGPWYGYAPRETSS